MGKVLICHERIVKRFKWFDSRTDVEALSRARGENNVVDKENNMPSGWATEDTDPGEYKAVEAIPDNRTSQETTEEMGRTMGTRNRLSSQTSKTTHETDTEVRGENTGSRDNIGPQEPTGAISVANS